MEISPVKVKVIQEWPVPKTKNQLQSFLGTTTYVQRFCKNFAMGGMLFQKQFRGGKEIERPIAFAGHKYKAAQVNYSVSEKGVPVRPTIGVETDHKSLETVFKQKRISRRIARWYDELAEYSFDIKYVRGVADGVSRRPDFEDTTEVITLASITTRAQLRDRVSNTLPAIIDEPWRAMKRTQAHLYCSNNKIFYQAHHVSTSRLVIPCLREISEALVAEFHDSPVYGHPGIDRTSRLIEASYFWPHLTSDVANQETQKHQGFLHSHAFPSRRWSHFAMDFITQLPKTEGGYDSVMVVVDQLSKRAHFAVGYTTDTAEDVGVRYQNEIFRPHGLPDLVLSDRDSKCTSSFWSKLCSLLGVGKKLTTAFRPQGDGITERINQFPGKLSSRVFERRFR
ncbi:LOW QUALITY PROTEIN: Pol Polyprotein [Phytophthora megakarya]|uniref:Pol Polyprotein n=1 Tax=Phytophthora megakarya TaxID=4795 RepID=A0A225VQN2_9STRA|nr:LOW QUALITY PROTEIN: Pol Polyprotein [Phytophthora megakarya]